MRRRRKIFDLGLQKQFEDKTESSRSLYEKALSEISLTKEKNSELLAVNKSLVEDNSRLLSANIKISIENSDKEELSHELKESVDFYYNETLKAVNNKNKAEKEFSDTNLLLQEKKNECDEEIKKLEIIKNNVKEERKFLDTLKEESSKNMLKISEQKKFLNTEEENLNIKKMALAEREEFLNRRALSNRQEDNRLNLYRERLNVHYRNLGFNIKL